MFWRRKKPTKPTTAPAFDPPPAVKPVPRVLYLETMGHVVTGPNKCVALAPRGRFPPGRLVVTADECNERAVLVENVPLQPGGRLYFDKPPCEIVAEGTDGPPCELFVLWAIE